MSLATLCASAQEESALADSLIDMSADSVMMQRIDSIMTADVAVAKTSTDIDMKAPKLKQPKPKRDWSTWKPSPEKAMWLGMVLPGAGQIYNRKYWKLPIIYGGIIGCLYAMSWNNQMYTDYSRAYLDLMDDDPATDSYQSFMHFGQVIDASNADRYKEIFRKRKDYYRRYRDMSFFILVGVYALSVIDAYVDAQLSAFDISDDLSMKIRPTTINNQSLYASQNPLKSVSLGVQCSLDF